MFLEKYITDWILLSQCSSFLQHEVWIVWCRRSRLSRLECPVCTQYMRPSIMLCPNGHKICNMCKRKVLLCPLCRYSVLDTTNVALQKLARQLDSACTFQKKGCRDMYSLALIGEHGKKWRYIEHVFRVQKRNLGTCNWTGNAGNRNSHLKEKHLCVWRCMHRASSHNMYINQQDTQKFLWLDFIFY